MYQGPTDLQACFFNRIKGALSVMSFMNRMGSTFDISVDDIKILDSE
jgi:hypothetical protein